MGFRSKGVYLSRLRANIWKAYVFGAIQALTLIMPIIVPFFRDLGLSMAQVFIAQAVFSVVIISLEIPSGYISDILGRRRTLIIGAWFVFFGYSTYAFAGGFWAVLGAEILLAVGSSFISGTDVAMLYDTLAELGRSDQYKRVEGNRQGIGRMMEGASSLVGGLLAVVTLRTPFYYQAAGMLLLVILAYTFVEPQTKRYRVLRGHFHALHEIVAGALRLDVRLRWLIAYSAIVSASTLTAIWLVQPYFTAAGLSIALYGVAWAAMYFIAALVSVYAHRIDELFGAKYLLFSLMLLPLAASLLLAVRVSLWLLVVIPAYQVVRALQNVVVSDYINRSISSETRATLVSAKNFLYRLLFAIIGPFIGAALDAWGVQVAFLMSGLIFGTLSLAAFIALRIAHRSA